METIGITPYCCGDIFVGSIVSSFINKYNHNNNIKELIMAKKTTEEFIIDAERIHGDMYSYEKVEYVNAKTKIEINCKEHGGFLMSPNKHLSSRQGCPKCAGNIKKTTTKFIKEAQKIHGVLYDYSLSEYIGAHEKVKIICQHHGVFEQIAADHIHNRSGCNMCGLIVSAKKQSKTTRQFIEEALKIHTDKKYDYSLV